MCEYLPHYTLEKVWIITTLNKKSLTICKAFSAENVGFEPTVPCGTTVFKTAAIDHSANSPG